MLVKLTLCHTSNSIQYQTLEKGMVWIKLEVEYKFFRVLKPTEMFCEAWESMLISLTEYYVVTYDVKFSYFSDICLFNHIILLILAIFCLFITKTLFAKTTKVCKRKEDCTFVRPNKEPSLV